VGESATRNWSPRSIRFGVLAGLLVAILAVTGYLMWRHHANETHRIEAPQLPSATALDHDVATRPGVAELAKIGGRIEIDPTNSKKPITKVYLTSTKATDADLALLKSWNALCVLDLSGTKITDAGLAHLYDLQALETLHLSFTEIKGDGLTTIAKLKRLETLDLSKTQVMDGALAHLKGLDALASLSLINVPVTDDGLKHLAALTSLRRLDLNSCTEITDEGLLHLGHLTKLEHLNLYGTYVTKAGIDQLRSKIPGAKIITPG
jgi:Leucine-rich repeat (LRR) protein